MSSDLAMVETLLDALEVEYTENISKDGLVQIKCEEGDRKVSGHNCSFVTFDFSGDGAFISIGAWE